MKNFFKLLGIIALVAVFGFSMIACSNGGGNPGPSPGPDPDPGPSEKQQWGDYWYYEYNREITITRYEGTGDNVTIPAQINGKPVTIIGRDAFEYCTSLTSVTIPDSVTSIEGYAFQGCSSLASITIGNSVTSIKTGAFKSCASLTNVTIPDSVTSIGEIVFEGCSSLASITIGSGVTSIGDGAFGFIENLTTINVDPANTAYSSEGGVLYNKNKTTLIRYPAKKTGISFVIPNSVTSIGNYAFLRCTSLTSVTIPSNVTSIGWVAFEYCTSLTSITIPGGVTSIESGTFTSCDSLTSVKFEGTIASSNFANAFGIENTGGYIGDLREKYLAADGGIGTYTREEGSYTWTKQP